MPWGRPAQRWGWRSELDDLRDRDRGERRRRRGREKGKAGGRIVRQYRELYPQLPGQVVGALVEKGVRPQSPEAQRAALLAIEQLRRENPVPARSPGAALRGAAAGQSSADLLAVAQAAAPQLPAGQAAPTGIEDPRALQFAAQSRTGSMAGGPALSPGGTEPSPTAFHAAITLNNERDARQRLQTNDPVTWDEFTQIEDLLNGKMNTRQRQRLNELLAGIDPSKREARAENHGRPASKEPYTSAEQRRLNIVAEYQADIRAGRLPETYREEDEDILTEMRFRLAGVTAEDVVSWDGDRGTLGPTGERKLEELGRTETKGPLTAAAVGDPLGRAGEVLQPALRGAQVGLLAPYELLQSGVRETAKSVSMIAKGENPYTAERARDPAGFEATTFGQTLDRLSSGERVDLGHGYLVDPRSEVAQSQAAAAREQYTINGHAATPGRLFSAGIAATGIIDPNDRAANIISGLVDAGVALSPLDPTNLVLGGAVVARRGARGFRAPARVAFEDAGIVPGARRFFIGETADQFLAGPKGSGVVQDLWEHRDDFGYVANRLGDADTAVRFVDAPDLNTARQVIRHNTGLPTLPTEEFGRAVPRLRERPTTPIGGHATFRARKKLSDVRFVAEMPNKPIDILDGNEGVMRLDQLQRTAKIPYDQRNVNNLDFARAVATGTRTEIIPIIERTYEQVVEQAALGTWGRTFGKTLGDPTESKYFKAFQKNMSSIFNRLEADRLYAADQIGHKAYPEFLLLDGEPKGLAHPSAEVEFLNRSIPVPDVREIRRMVSWLGPVYRTPGARQLMTGPTTFMDVVYQQFFKPAALVTRFSYPLRVVAEGQMRLAAGGYEGLFNHPLEYFAWAVGRKGTATTDNVIAQAVAEAGGPGGRHAFAEAMNREVGVPAMLREPGTPTARLNGRIAYHISEDGHLHAWAEELTKMNASPTMRTLATIGRGATKEEFFTGSLKGVREDLVKAGGGWTRLADRRYADEYIDWLDEVRVRPFVQEDTELLEAVRTGRLRGEPIIDTTGKVVKKPRINPKVLDDLENRRIAGNAPEWAPGDKVEIGPARDKVRNAMDNAIQWGFAHTIGVAEDSLNRSPQWRQAYWRNAETVLPYAKNPEDAAKLVRKAEKQLKQYPEWLPEGLGDAQIARLRTAAQKSGQGELTFDHLDKIAGARAADDVKNLLFDLSKRNQFFDTFRFVFPFGDAFREVLTRWMKLVPENPKVVYRGIQAISGAQESGIFHEDANGNTVFTYFGAPWLSQLFGAATGAGPGAPVGLAGPVQGLNLAGSLLPGVGPAVTVSARYFEDFLPDGVQKTFHEFIYPYGEPDPDDPFFSAVDTLIPAWMDKWLAAAGSPLHEELRARTTMQIARQLYSSGEYGSLEEMPDGTKVRMLNDKDVRQLMADARSKTTRFLIFQGGAQNILPSTPIPQWKVATQDGKMVLATELSKVFYKWVNDEKIGYDGAIARFVNTFGPDAFMAVEGMTDTLVYGLEHTERALEWETEHSGFSKKFPLVAGFFAPRTNEDEFDISVYQQRIDNGQLQQRDPELMVREGQNALGEWIYNKEKESVGDDPTDEEREYLKDVETWLLNNMSGYKSKHGVIGKADPDEAIRQIRRAINDSDVKDSDTAQGVRHYLRMRDRAAREAKERGITNWWTADRTRDLVESLREHQAWVREEYGAGAGQVMDELFGRDVRSAED